MIDALKSSRRYGTLADAALVRAARWALARARSEKDAVRVAKRKLHQVHGAFVSGGHLTKAEALVAGGGPIDDVCRGVLGCQTSTMQRLAYADELYANVRGVCRAPRRVLDLACGLHPFALPSMGLPDACSYEAVEVDHRFTDLVAHLDGWMPQEVTARTVDLVSEPVEREVDLVFLLNALPSLEQQEKGSAGAVLDAARAPVTIVSFPARSLCGRTPMRRADAARVLEASLPLGALIADAWSFSHETVYVVRRD